jgi:hypothetical protein
MEGSRKWPDSVRRRLDDDPATSVILFGPPQAFSEEDRMRFDRLFLTALLLALAQGAAAQALTLGQVKQKGGTPLTKEELVTLLPDSEYRRQVGTVYTHWTNFSDGTVEAGRINSGTRTVRYNRDGQDGTWRVRGDGAYCVDVRGDYPAKWCRTIYRLGNGYYAFSPRADDEAKAWKFSLKQ